MTTKRVSKKEKLGLQESKPSKAIMETKNGDLYIIYEEFGKFYVTNKDNYDARVSNEREIVEFEDAISLEDCIKSAEKYMKLELVKVFKERKMGRIGTKAFINNRNLPSRYKYKESRTFGNESVELFLAILDVTFIDDYGIEVETTISDSDYSTLPLEADTYSILRRIALLMNIDDNQLDKKSFRVMNNDRIYVKGLIELKQAQYLTKQASKLSSKDGIVEFEVSAIVYEQILRQATRKSLSSYGIS